MPRIIRLDISSHDFHDTTCRGPWVNLVNFTEDDGRAEGEVTRSGEFAAAAPCGWTGARPADAPGATAPHPSARHARGESVTETTRSHECRLDAARVVESGTTQISRPARPPPCRASALENDEPVAARTRTAFRPEGVAAADRARGAGRKPLNDGVRGPDEDIGRSQGLQPRRSRIEAREPPDSATVTAALGDEPSAGCRRV